MGAYVILTRSDGQAITVKTSTIGLLVSRQRGCTVWDTELKNCIRVRETCSQVLQAMQNTRTIIPS